ncbi:MAG: radical SAM protein [Candidatus Hadarchaeales archaeon]
MTKLPSPGRMLRRENPRGSEIVLTASWVEFSDFKLNPFIAFTGSFPYFIPLRVLRSKWYPPTPKLNGTAKFAPYGLRKLQALLEKAGREVVVCTPDSLARFVGKRTKVVGVSSMDPLGMGFVSRTYTSLLGFRESISAVEFRSLLKILQRLKRKYGFRLVVGGAGAWQIPRSGLQEKLGVDTVVVGEVEGIARELFEKLLGGKEVEKVVYARRAEMEEVPAITQPSLFGVVEITRGCGKGCQFCSPTMRKFYSFPLKRILEEAKLNAGAGSRMIILQTDDIFLYRHLPRFVPNRREIVRLLKEVSRVPGVEYLQIAHASLPPVVYDPKMVEEIAPILVEKSRWKCRGKRVAAVEVGIETGSTRLLEKYMAGKALPLEAKNWSQIVVEAVEILNENSIYPLGTIVVGLPGETEGDLMDTLELVDRLWGKGIFFVPLLFTSEEDCMLKKARQVESKHLGELYWEFFALCWKHNVRVWSPGTENKLRAVVPPLYPLFYRWRFGNRVEGAFRILSGFEDIRPRTIVQKN